MNVKAYWVLKEYAYYPGVRKWYVESQDRWVGDDFDGGGYAGGKKIAAEAPPFRHTQIPYLRLFLLIGDDVRRLL